MRREEGRNAEGLYWLALGEGPTVVVLHGGPGADHGYLLPQFGTLADEFRLLFYDQRGGGRSRDAGREPTWRQHVADLESIRPEFDLGRMRLVGYSWGGLLALLFTLEHPASVERLALCSPAAPVHHYRAELARTLAERARRPAAAELSGFARAVAGYFVNPVRARELTEFRVQTRAEKALHASLGEYDLRPRLPEIRQPVLVLHGTGDPIPVRYSEELARLLPNAQLVLLPDCGHVPYIECPEPFFGALRGFLRGSEPSTNLRHVAKR